MSDRARWNRYRSELCEVPSLGLSVDPSCMGHPPDLLEKMGPELEKAFAAMEALEKGAIANPDEQRMVGHYWLRDPSRAPNSELRGAIEDTLAAIEAFAADVHEGRKVNPEGARFTDLLVVGIGGSALGPQLVTRALGSTRDRLAVSFFDNTDPDGFDLVVDRLGARLATTLVVVISKSGGTKETRNGMLEAKWALERKGLSFGPRAVAVTGEGSALDVFAKKEGFLARFPMWDWVGGRTSELSAVGLLPAALQGLDVRRVARGRAPVRRGDAGARGAQQPRGDPRGDVALRWRRARPEGHGGAAVQGSHRAPVALPAAARDGVARQGEGPRGQRRAPGHRGLRQQGLDRPARLRPAAPRRRAELLRHVHRGAEGPRGHGRRGGARGHERRLPARLLPRHAPRARRERSPLAHHHRARRLAPLARRAHRALRARGGLLREPRWCINAYHQPGVEAGKKAAAEVLALQAKIVAALDATPRDVEAIGSAIGSEDLETVHKICVHLAANGRLRREGDRFARG